MRLKKLVDAGGTCRVLIRELGDKNAMPKVPVTSYVRIKAAGSAETVTVLLIVTDEVGVI